MANILDKKERVYDLRLTAYGRYLLSVGKYKASQYAFFDDNVIYDYQYCNISESQNSINERIKNDTSYLGSMVLFEDVNSAQQKLVRMPPDLAAQDLSEEDRSYYEWAFRRTQNYFAADVEPIQYLPRQDTFKFDSAIGDAMLSSKDTNVAPAWKIVVLNGKITGSSPSMLLHSSSSASVNIPQVDIVVEYEKEIRSSEFPIPSESGELTLSEMINKTPNFSDQNYIRLKKQDPIIYVDEVNTELLTENFDIEVFLITGSVLQRKYFESETPQIIDGIMTRPAPDSEISISSPPLTSVDYYFDFKNDALADSEIVCKKMKIYNKTSYYIDLDLDCTDNNIEDAYNDIYGSEVEPEICP